LVRLRTSFTSRSRSVRCCRFGSFTLLRFTDRLGYTVVFAVRLPRICTHTRTPHTRATALFTRTHHLTTLYARHTHAPHALRTTHHRTRIFTHTGAHTHTPPTHSRAFHGFALILHTHTHHGFLWFIATLFPRFTRLVIALPVVHATLFCRFSFWFTSRLGFYTLRAPPRTHNTTAFHYTTNTTTVSFAFGRSLVSRFSIHVYAVWFTVNAVLSFIFCTVVISYARTFLYGFAYTHTTPHTRILISFVTLPFTVSSPVGWFTSASSSWFAVTGCTLFADVRYTFRYVWLPRLFAPYYYTTLLLPFILGLHVCPHTVILPHYYVLVYLRLRVTHVCSRLRMPLVCHGYVWFTLFRSRIRSRFALYTA